MEPYVSDTELLAMCEQELRQGNIGGTSIRAAQKKALDQYYLENPAPALWSTVQSSDVRDAVESTMPVIMDMFAATEAPVAFKPTNSNDIKQAETETAYCQNVLFTQNDGELIIYNWFKDAMLFKNGYVKIFWDNKVDYEREDYEALTQEEYSALLVDDKYEAQEVAQDPVTGAYAVRGLRASDAGQVRVVNIPADRVFVSASHTSTILQTAAYVGHMEFRTKSSLIIDGYDPDVVATLPSSTLPTEYGRSLNTTQLRQNFFASTAPSGDKSRDIVEYYEHYIRADRDGDGVSELLQVCAVGGLNGVLLSVKEIDQIPIYAATAYPVPHSHYGLSLAELVGETQDIKTTLMRQMLDNLYLSNKPMLEVDTTRVINTDKLGKLVPGMIIQKRGDAPAVTPISVPFVAAAVLPVLQQIDAAAMRKTGMGDTNSGLDATTLAGSTNLVGAMTLNQSQLRPKAMVRMLCQTGLRHVMYRIRELVMKYMRREDMVAMAGEWVPIDPRSWREKRNTDIRIGLGTVQKQERLGVLQRVMELQEKIVASQGGTDGPLVNAANLFNSLQDLERVAGHSGNERYFSDPAKFQPPAPGPDVASEALEIERAKLEVDAAYKASGREIEAFKAGLDAVKLKAELANQNAAQEAQAIGDELRK